MKKIGSLLLILSLSWWPAVGADVEVSAAVNADRIGLNALLVYTLSFKGINNPVQPELASLADFTVVQSSRSSEFQFVNGISSYYTNFSFYLKPRRTGKLTLPPHRFSYQGREITTQAFFIEVVAGNVAPPAGQAPSQAPSLFDDDSFANKQDREAAESIDVRLQAELSKAEAYRGEQILYRVLLVTSNRVESVSMTSSGTFPGFWQEWYPIPQSISGQTEFRKGVAYQIYEIRKAALYPTQSGTLTIPPCQYEIQVVRAGLSLFTDIQKVIRSSPALRLRVLEPPPEASQLPVGRFTVELAPQNTNVDIHTLLSLKLTIRGDGNVKTIIVPTLADNPAYQAYPAKIATNLEYGRDALRGVLQAEIPVSFSSSGAITLPGMNFPYFDPVSKKVISWQSAPLILQVSGEKQTGGQSLFRSQDLIEARGEDIDFISSGRILDQSQYPARQPWFLPLLLFPLLFNLLTAGKQYLWNPWLASSPLLRRRRTLRLTLKKLNKVHNYTEIATILENYIRANTRLKLAEISTPGIRAMFSSQNVPDSLVKPFLELLAKSELARYSPVKKTPGELQSDLRLLNGILRQLDKKIS